MSNLEQLFNFVTTAQGWSHICC